MVVMEFLHSVTLDPRRQSARRAGWDHPQVSGSILQLNVTDNQRVKAGEVLFTIDDTPYRIAVLNAQAQLAKAQAEVAKAQAEQSKAASEARRRRSLSQNAISAEDLENVNTALNTATTTLAAARAGSA